MFRPSPSKRCGSHAADMRSDGVDKTGEIAVMSGVKVKIETKSTGYVRRKSSKRVFNERCREWIYHRTDYRLPDDPLTAHDVKDHFFTSLSARAIFENGPS